MTGDQGPFDFDTPIDRRNTGCSKWSRFADDVLPLWVADMDFAVTPAIIEAIERRLAHPVLGYAVATSALRAQIVDTLAERYQWRIEPEDLIFLPGVEPGLNMTLKAMLRPGDGVAVHTPAYPPLLRAPDHWGLARYDIPLQRVAGAGYRADPRRQEDALRASRALLLCNPQNPVGKVFGRAELEEIAAQCTARDVLIVSDEIHCDLVFGGCGHGHIPIAALDPDIGHRTVTLMAASKTYNIAGLKTAFAVIQNPEMRAAISASRLGMVDSVNCLGLEATLAAYAQGETWRRALLRYLEANRDYLMQAVADRLPGITAEIPDGTFLAWLDCAELDLPTEPHLYFLEHARVGLNAGTDFGPGGETFVRLNFGCPRVLLEDGIARLEGAIQALHSSRADGRGRRPAD